MSTGLLQRVAVRHLWRSYSTATVSTESGGTARHWCFPTWSYHSGAETAPLVACKTENWFQIFGACLQVIAWSCSAVPVGRLSTRHGRGTSTSQVFRRLHVCRPADTVTDWWQQFYCSRTAAMKQPTDRDPDEWHCHSSGSLSVGYCGTTFGHYRRLLKAFLFV